MSNDLTITYIPALGNYVAIQDDRVVGANTNRDALVAEVGEPTESSEGVPLDVEELLNPPTDARATGQL